MHLFVAIVQYSNTQIGIVSILVNIEKKEFFLQKFNCNTKCIRNTCRTPTRHKFLASGSGRQPRPGLQRLQGHCLYDSWMKVLVEKKHFFIHFGLTCADAMEPKVAPRFT